MDELDFEKGQNNYTPLHSQKSKTDRQEVVVIEMLFYQ
jgi:hypothetical protein